MNTITYKPIGIVHSPFNTVEDMPIQSLAAMDVQGTVEIFPEFLPGLQDLEGFSHFFLLYSFHRAGPARLTIRPFLDQTERGIFATRAPVRPNPIGLSILELISREDNFLFVKGLDILDGTPVLDIKPYIEKFDHPINSKSGWLEDKLEKLYTTKTDSRFTEDKV